VLEAERLENGFRDPERQAVVSKFCLSEIASAFINCQAAKFEQPR
jgi:hypothetical protein